MNKPRHSRQDVEAALRAAAGLRSVAARKLGLTPQGLAKIIAKSAPLQTVERDIVEATLDLAEGTVLAAIRDKSLKAAMFYLKAKGKHRGYTERQEVTGAEGGPVNVAVDVTRLSNEALERLAAGDLSVVTEQRPAAPGARGARKKGPPAT